MYYSAPYTKGGIEKAAIKLGGFGKTPEIEPGQFADVKIEMPVEEMKSYDCYDRNNNGFMGYELEKGNYEISFRSDVHTLKDGMEENLRPIRTRRVAKAAISTNPSIPTRILWTVLKTKVVPSST